MAKTYPKRGIQVFAPNDAYLSSVSVYLPEGLNQTYTGVNPVVVTSGYVVLAADPVTAIAGICVEDAHNAAAGAYSVRVIPVSEDVGVYANFLGNAAADNVLAAADLYLKRDFEYDANMISTGVGGWYIEDGAAAASVRIVSFNSDIAIPNNSESIAVAGDTNARVSAVFLASVVQAYIA